MPESVGQAVKAAFKGGAQFIILSRRYTETKPENLSGTGAGLQKPGVIQNLAEKIGTRPYWRGIFRFKARTRSGRMNRSFGSQCISKRKSSS